MNSRCVSNGASTVATDDHWKALPLWGQLAFELKSLIGRALFNRRPPKQANPRRLLNLGCGSVLFEGWVNADFYTLRFWRAPASFWMVDLRRRLTCKSEYWDGVFSEHTLEHLTPAEARHLIAEIRRILKPGAMVRLSVPDLKKYVAYYREGEGPEEFHQWRKRAEAIGALTQSWGHKSVWDANLLCSALTEAGFTNVAERQFGEGRDPALTREASARRWESVYVEAERP